MWDIDRLKPEQLSAAVRETHSEPQILGSEPYPGPSRPSGRGTRPVTSSTSPASRGTPASHRPWLRADRPGYDELYCSYDKVSRCAEIGIDVLIDDSPDILAARSTPASPPRR